VEEEFKKLGYTFASITENSATDEECDSSKEPISAENNDELVKKNDYDAIHRQIDGFIFGQYGYEKNLKKAFELNEARVKLQDLKAIERSITGSTTGNYGYPKYPTLAVERNDKLIERGDYGALERKIVGLRCGANGYWSTNPIVAVRELLEKLADKGILAAMEKNIISRIHGKHGFKKDPSLLRNYLNLLAND